MNVITKLALSRIRTKKARSIVICTSIFLTIILFMTVVSISANLLTGFGLTMRLAAGTDLHGYLRATSFTLDVEDLRDAVLEGKNVEKAFISYTASRYAETEGNVLTSSDFIYIMENEEALSHFYTEITEGTFPKNDTEILLNPLFFQNAAVGDEITLYYLKNHEEYRETASAVFTVSGLMDSAADSPIPAILAYSDTLEDTYEFGSWRNETIYFLFGNTINLAGKYDLLVNDTLKSVQVTGEESFGVLNTAYLEAGGGEGLNAANVFLIVFSVLVVFFCSFLLIYNVYSIALQQDMQSFGLLNVIGTTHKQIRRITALQSLILYAVTLPISLIAGYFIGWKLLSPVLFSDVFSTDVAFEFHPLIPVVTALLALFTLLWSASRPLKKLQRLTPISAVEYSPAADVPVWYVRKKNYVRKNVTPNAGRMAKYTLSRNRKKTIITALSMSMSVVLFVLIATLCDYMVAYTWKHIESTDFRIHPQQVFEITGSNSEHHPVPENAEDELISSLDAGFGLSEEYVKLVEELRYTDRVWKIRTAMFTASTPSAARSRLRELKKKIPEYIWEEYWTEAMNGKLPVSVVGIPDDLFGELTDSDMEKIGEGYEEGYVICDTSATQNLRVHREDGTIVHEPLNYYYDGDTITLYEGSYTVRVNTWGTPSIYLTGYQNTLTADVVLYLPESAFLREFGEGLTDTLLVDAKDGCYDLLRTELEETLDSVSITVNETMQNRYTDMRNSMLTFRVSPTDRADAFVKGRLDSVTDIQTKVMALQTVGYSLAAMIFLIGTLNIVNTALSSATERKREFAMLEAVGMTDRQMMRMLLTESLYSGGAAVLITVGMGFPLIAVIINTAMDALVSLHWLSGVIMLAVCIAVSILSGLAVFRLTKSAAVVERIKVE